MTSVDEKGREKKAVAYKGSYFDFEIAEEDYQGFRKLAWALIVAMIALQIGAGFVANRGMYQIYIAVPYVLCFFPLVYLSAGALRLPVTEKAGRTTGDGEMLLGTVVVH